MTFDYRSSFELGHKYSRLVTQRLQDCGVEAELQPLEFARDEQDRERFTLHEKDIVTAAGVLEVKSSSRVFGDDPFDYPASSLIVDTLHGFNAKVRKPVAYCMVSQATQAMLVVPVSSRHEWWVQNLYDRKREIYDDFLLANKSVLRSFAELVDWLKGKQR
jgi:predicted 2-oxoglutarate/Fe(II)-dependent dioxygenase YbiX